MAMNRLRAKVLFLFLFLAGVASIAGSGLAGEAKTPRYKFGLALPTLSEERWTRDLEVMLVKAKELGVELVVQVTMNDQEQQSFNADQLLTSGVSVIILNPHDSAGAAPIVEAAHKAGIKVLSYDRLIANAPVDLYVSFDNEEIGRMQGRFLVEKAPKGNYIILSGPRYDSNANFYRNAAVAELRPLIDKGAITVILDRDVPDWNPNSTTELVEAALIMAKNNVAAILAPNDGMASGAIVALKNQKLAGRVVVTGQDADLKAARRIVAGDQTMTIFKDVRQQAETALRAAMMLADGKDVKALTGGRVVNNGKFDIPSVLLKAVVVDRNNLDDVLIGSGFWKKSDIYP